MTDPISTYGRPLGVNGNRSTARQETSKGVSEATPQTPSAARSPDTPSRPVQGEQLQLSETARRTMADPGFDRAKVDAIKTALREGTYPLDSRKIAESFVALERLIDN